jgi:hypothetical protein
MWVVVANWQTEPACQPAASAFKLDFTIRHVPSRLKLAPIIHFEFLKRVSGEYHMRGRAACCAGLCQIFAVMGSHELSREKYLFGEGNRSS